MGLIREFKEFALKGNVIDMAVGIVIGGAFNNIVQSLVKDVIMPPIGMLMNRVDFSNLGIVLKEDSDKAKEVAIKYGMFLNQVISFIIVAMALFVLIKWINTLRRLTEKPATPAPSTKECPKCLMPIPVKAVKCGHCTADL